MGEQSSYFLSPISASAQEIKNREEKGYIGVAFS